MLNWLLICVAYMALDMAFAKYVLATSATQPTVAALWAVVIVFFNGLIVLLFVSDPILLIPAAIGAFIGTYYVVRP